MIPIIYSDDFLQHDTGKTHPECPERLLAIVQALKAAPWANQLQWQLPTPVAQRDVIPLMKRVHTERHIEIIKQIAARGGGRIDMDTPVSPRSYDIALLAVNAWLDGIDQVLANNNPAFILARPPGHHATSHQAMGFCLFSNAAIAAHHALDQPGIRRVAILDWDVHHGNGTEEIIEHHPQIAYCSLHQYPCYPGTGKASDRGMYDNVLNIPMVSGSTLKEYQTAFTNQVIPFLRKFHPDILLISAGYDANHDDPLASISLQPQDFGIFTEECLKITRRLVIGLEGGYNLTALAQSVVATVETCLIK